jgi:hypothetical protein
MHITTSEQASLELGFGNYYPDGTFSPWAMDEGLNEFYRESQEDDLRKIRGEAHSSLTLPKRDKA